MIKPQPDFAKETLSRELSFKRELVDSEARTVEVAISSETPVERWFGMEVLDHSRGAVDLTRLSDGGPVLCDHDPCDIVGVLDAVSVGSDKVLRGTVRFGRSARAQEVFQDVQDGIRTKISVGYRINAYEVIEGKGGAPSTYRATQWLPYEMSFVSIPADMAVGVGRSTPPTQPAPVANTPEVRMEPTTPAAPAANVNVDELRTKATHEATKRASEILAFCSTFGFAERAADYIGSGRTVTDVKEEIFQEVQKRAGSLPAPKPPVATDDLKGFSMARAIMNAHLPQEKCFEREVSDEISKKLSRSTSGIFIPSNLSTRAALDAKTAGAAKELVNTEPLTFIEMLRNRTMVLAMGATFLPGLVGNVPFVRQITGGTATWTGDNPASATAESNPTVQLFTMTPKQLMAVRSYSKQLLTQTAGVADSFVNNDLSKAHALALDLAALAGTGASNQPTGILSFAGLALVALGTNGLAPTYASMVDLEGKLASSNADVNTMGYLSNAKMRAALKKIGELDSAYNQAVWKDGKVNGYRAEVSNQIPANLTKGTGTNLSACIFADWSSLLVGEWGALDVVTDPYSLADKGLIRVISTQLADVNYQHLESFAAIVDAIA